MKKKNVCIYVRTRYSSRYPLDKETVQWYAQDCIAIISSHPDWNLIGIYVDTKSGSGTNRPGLNQLIADIEEKSIELIIVHHSSVITPNTTFLRRFKETIEEKGAEIYDALEKGEVEPFGVIRMY
jgi:DNA invertase Pin-like site-specific DNA recombinase